MTYTHGHHESVLRSHRWRTVENSAAYAAPYFVAGARVLDVGCGPGTITIDIAKPGRTRRRDRHRPLGRGRRGRERERVGHRECRVRDRRRVRARFPRRLVRRRARAPGVAASPRSGRRTPRDATGLQAGRRSSPRATATTTPSRGTRPTRDSWRGRRSTARSPGRTGGEPDAGRMLLAGRAAPASPRSSPRHPCGASQHPKTATGGESSVADRMTTSAIAEQAEREKFAPRAVLEDIAGRVARMGLTIPTVGSTCSTARSSAARSRRPRACAQAGHGPIRRR